MGVRNCQSSVVAEAGGDSRVGAAVVDIAPNRSGRCRVIASVVNVLLVVVATRGGVLMTVPFSRRACNASHADGVIPVLVRRFLPEVLVSEIPCCGSSR
jgi:hypothetical protein